MIYISKINLQVSKFDTEEYADTKQWAMGMVIWAYNSAYPFLAQQYHK